MHNYNEKKKAATRVDSSSLVKKQLLKNKSSKYWFKTEFQLNFIVFIQQLNNATPKTKTYMRDQTMRTRQLLLVFRFGRIHNVWLVTFSILDHWPSAWSFVLAEELDVSCLSLPNKHFAFPPFCRQMEALMLSFLLFVSSCFSLSLYFPKFHYCLLPGCLWLESTLKPPFNFLWAGGSRTVSLQF